MASVPFTCCPVARHTTFDPQVLRLLLFRRLPAMFAGVAVHSIPVATTAQHVLWRGFSGVGGFAIESAALECAEKRVGGVHQHPHPGTWTSWPQTCLMIVEWRSWLTGCLCSTGSSWRKTQHWCLRWDTMVFHAFVAPTSLAGERNAITLTHTPRCPCCGSGRHMVSRIGAIPGAAGQSASRAQGDAGQRSVRLDQAVEVYVGLRSRPSFRLVTVGTSSWSWF